MHICIISKGFHIFADQTKVYKYFIFISTFFSSQIQKVQESTYKRKYIPSLTIYGICRPPNFLLASRTPPGASPPSPTHNKIYVARCLYTFPLAKSIAKCGSFYFVCHHITVCNLYICFVCRLLYIMLSSSHNLVYKSTSSV